MMCAIIMLAALLRCYRLPQIPFTNDELSALLRLQYHSFNELIELGIKPDGHPALVQVFLYFYTKLFGLSVVSIKLPFILCGLLSIWLSNRIASKLFNRNLGLLVAAFMATNEYFIMYSQVARPYAPGLLFVLCFAWTGIFIMNEEKPKMITIMMHALWLSASFYTHYFAGLTACLIALTFLLLHPKKLSSFARSYILAFILYVPHLPVFMTQLQTGGVGGNGGWLGKPHFNFIVDFSAYLFQFSWMTYLLMTIAFGSTLYFGFRASKKDILVLFSSFMIFILSLAIGYLYSVYINPVLQYSVLLFATPFLFMTLLFGMSRWRNKYVYLFLLLAISTNVFALIQQRKYYQLFYHQGYQACAEFLKKYEGHVIYLNGNHSFYFNHYLNQYKVSYNIINTHFDTIPYLEFKKQLKQFSAMEGRDTLILAYAMSGNPEYISLVQEFYPVLLHQEKGANFEGYIFCKKGKDQSSNSFIASSTPHNNQIEILPSNQEFGKESILKMAQLKPSDVIEIKSSIFKANNEANPILVLSILNNKNEQISWTGNAYHQFKLKDDTSTLVTIRMLVERAAGENLTIKTFFWNVHHDQFTTTQPNITILKGNPWLYGLVEKIPDGEN